MFKRRSTMSLQSSFIVAARRSAIGRVGGLHRRRRIEELAGPVIVAALADAGIAPDRVNELIAGNVSASGNPARLMALAAGLPGTVAAMTVDRECASGLDAILHGARLIATGEASIVVAGGAESLSTAPWRLAKPRTIYQTPRFDNQNAAYDQTGDADPHIAAAELLAGELQLTRDALDAYALRSHIRAYLAHEAKRFLGEIVPLRLSAEETRDESLDGDLTADDLADIAPFVEGDRTSAGNTALPHDGAAFAILVSEKIWRELGEIPGLRLKASVACGVVPGREASAPVEALRKLGERVNGHGLRAFGQFELGETSAAQAIAVRDQLGLEDELLNPDGGALARGMPIGASGAIAVTRLFSRMARNRTKDFVRQGIAVQGCKGGLGVAAAFEAV
jgi:acetyl-CoA C-acetyltransferase